MSPLSLAIALICVTVLMSAVSSQPTYHLPHHGSNGESINYVETVPSNSLEYQIVPSSEYAVATVQPSESSILDYMLSPVTAIVSLGSTALSVASWVIIKGSLVVLGMVIVIGFCALTPYCTLIIEKPAFLGRESTSTFPYLDDLEYFISEAYNKYHEMQKSA